MRRRSSLLHIRYYAGIKIMHGALQFKEPRNLPLFKKSVYVCTTYQSSACTSKVRLFAYVEYCTSRVLGWVITTSTLCSSNEPRGEECTVSTPTVLLLNSAATEYLTVFAGVSTVCSVHMCTNHFLDREQKVTHRSPCLARPVVVSLALRQY